MFRHRHRFTPRATPTEIPTDTSTNTSTNTLAGLRPRTRETGQMELTDDVITLRSPVEADADTIADAVSASYAKLAPFMPWAKADYSASDSLDWMHGRVDPDAHRFVIVDPAGDIVGSCGLNGINTEHRFANLGYWVATPATGVGHATRATRLLARYGLGQANFIRLEITMSVDNDASRAVARRSGAHYEGVLRQRLILRDGVHDAHLFSFVSDDLDGVPASDS